MAKSSIILTLKLADQEELQLLQQALLDTLQLLNQDTDTSAEIKQFCMQWQLRLLQLTLRENEQ